jgi:uncharacterized protein
MVNAASQTLLINGPAGRIEVGLDLPTTVTRGVAVIAHPHPLHGGTRDNKVVQTLARALLNQGFVCWRPNFRGVGDSEGQYNEGIGESEDLLTLTEYALTHSSVIALATPPLLVLAGFSFGSFVQAQVAERLLAQGRALERLILVGAAVSRFKLPKVAASTLLIHGEVDDVVPLADVLRWAEPRELPVTVIPGADHFFHHKLGIIKQIVQQALPI